MKENSIKEDIEILEEKMNKELDFLIENANKTEQLTAISIIAMKEPIILLFLSILSDYKKVLKENEELKSKNKTLEELLQGNLYELYKYYKELAGVYQGSCILVQEVKDKIEKEIKYHEKNILDIETTTMLKGKTAKEEAEIEFNKYAIVVLKKMLQELLEGRK